MGETIVGFNHVRNLVRTQLGFRPSFRPIRFGFCTYDGKFYYSRRSGEFPNSPMAYKAAHKLLEHGGHIVIDGADKSQLVVDFGPPPVEICIRQRGHSGPCNGFPRPDCGKPKS